MNNKVLQLKIVSAEKMLYNGKATSVKLPGMLGGFSILPEHAPLISSLKAGIIIYMVDDVPSEINIESGFVEVKQDVVIVCIES